MNRVSTASPIIHGADSPRRARGLTRHLSRLISSQLRVNIASGLVTTAVNVLLMLVSYPLYLHYLGWEMVGIWAVLGTVQDYAQRGVLGIGPALTKLVAEERGRGDDAGAQRYVSLATLMVSVTGAVAVFALLAFRVPVVRLLGLSGDNAAIALKLLPFMGILTAVTFLNQVITSTLAGIGRIDISNYCVTAAKVAALGLEVTLLLRGWGVETLLLGDCLGCCVIHVAGHVYLHRRTGIRVFCRNPWDSASFSRLISFVGSVFVASWTDLLVAPLNKVALSHYAGVGFVPVFEIAFNGTMQLRSLAEVALRALMPAVSHRSAAGTLKSRRDIRRLYDGSLYVLLVMTPPFYALGVLLARPLLKVWLSTRFRPEIVTTVDILWASALVSLIAVPAYFVLMATNGVRSCMVSHLVAAVVNVAYVGACIWFTGTITLGKAASAVLIAAALQSVFLMIRNRLALRRAVARPAEGPSRRHEIRGIAKPIGLS